MTITIEEGFGHPESLFLERQDPSWDWKEEAPEAEKEPKKREEAKRQKTFVRKNETPEPIDEKFDEVMNEESGIESTNPMKALLASAKAREARYDAMPDNEDDDKMKKNLSNGDDEIHLAESHTISYPSSRDFFRRAFDKIFKTVLSSADILFYVLDVRDLNGTRSQEIERQIAAADDGFKRLILILNKIDLVPSEVFKSWFIYLRRFFLTIPLRASHAAPNARTFDHKALTIKVTSKILLRALKIYANDQQFKRSIIVGIVGYLNVGKSSVINAFIFRLSGSTSTSSRTAWPVGTEAGITTALREVKLDN